MQTPQRTRQSHIGELVTLPPPQVPNAAHVLVGSVARSVQFAWEQPTQAQQAGLKCFGLAQTSQPSRTQFAQTLHRPDIVLIAQRAEESFPQGLFPTDLSSPGFKN